MPDRGCWSCAGQTWVILLWIYIICKLSLYLFTSSTWQTLVEHCDWEFKNLITKHKTTQNTGWKEYDFLRNICIWKCRSPCIYSHFLALMKCTGTWALCFRLRWMKTPTFLNFYIFFPFWFRMFSTQCVIPSAVSWELSSSNETESRPWWSILNSSVNVCFQLCSLCLSDLSVQKLCPLLFFSRFESIQCAQKVKAALNGADIYAGCCTLKIEYARVRDAKCWVHIHMRF